MNLREFIHFFSYETTRFLTPMLVATEWVFVAIGAILVAAAPPGLGWLLRRCRDGFRRLGARRRLAIAICGLAPIAIRLSLAGVVPVPEPSIHDEFSHLLLGDTLAHGRLANPPHPMWKHFESIHIIQQPTYSSMYPPGQGAVLALGEAAFGEPWAGVVISVGVMFAAICWMMQGWLPPKWAFFGTWIAILKVGVVGLWMNSYLGGAVAATGGALLFGAAVRIKRGEARTLHGVLAGLGPLILMNTRPFEGAILTCAAFVYVAPSLWRMLLGERERLVRRIVAPAGILLLGGFVFTGYYCWRVTGDPLRMPYQVNRDTYGWPENLAFLPPKQLTLRHQAMQNMYVKEVRNREAYADFRRAVDSLVTRVFDNWVYLLGPLLTVPLFFLPRIFGNRRTRPLVVFVSIIAVLNLFQLVLYPYHLAPIVPVVFAIVAEGARRIYLTLARAHRRRANYFVVVLASGLIVVGGVKQWAQELAIPLFYWERAAEGHQQTRAYLQQWLKSRPGQHLVIVRYAPHHDPNQEWVYNGADIDGSEVVWAREMDRASNARLLRYFSDREAWLLEADAYPQRVVRYRSVKDEISSLRGCISCF